MEEKKQKETETKAEIKGLFEDAGLDDDTSSNDSALTQDEYGEDGDLATIEIKAYGLPEKASRTCVDKGILKSKDFQRSLFEKCFEQGIQSIEERKLCLKILWKAGVPISDHNLSSDNLRQFVLTNITNGPARIAKLASHILSTGIDRSEDFKKSLLNVLLEMLPQAIDTVYCLDGEQQYIKLLSKLWAQDPTRLSTEILSNLKALGKKLYQDRSAIYNLLRTHFDVFDNVLEPSIFRPTNLKKQDSKTQSHKLTPTILDRSPEATVTTNQSTLKVRFTSIQFGNNWIVIDLQSVCCLTGIEIFWTADYSSTPTKIEIETWSHSHSNPSHLAFAEIDSEYSSEETPNLIFSDLSRKCRYLRVIARPEFPGNTVCELC